MKHLFLHLRQLNKQLNKYSVSTEKRRAKCVWHILCQCLLSFSLWQDTVEWLSPPPPHCLLLWVLTANTPTLLLLCHTHTQTTKTHTVRGTNGDWFFKTLCTVQKRMVEQWLPPLGSTTAKQDFCKVEEAKDLIYYTHGKSLKTLCRLTTTSPLSKAQWCVFPDSTEAGHITLCCSLTAATVVK